MSKATVYNVKGEKVKDLELDSEIFGLEINPEVVSQAVIAQQANARDVLAHAKDRSEVAGGGKKPWRQKGTGRARHGSIRSPLWKGGGITFGPSRDRNFSQKINRKAKKKALLMTLTDKAVNEKIVLLDNFNLEEAKTKNVYDVLKNVKLRTAKKLKKDKDEKSTSSESRILVVLPKQDEKIVRATRNIAKADTITADSLNVVDVLKATYLLMPVDSVDVIKKTFVK